MAVDPVCKMWVDEKKTAATSGCNGTTEGFCTPGWKKVLDPTPEK